ncbi:hypothetical protein CGRA01v4_09890 [Colletotrichum graminicola]|nr:hypothetical protein CGRA01v4_09890 [Colletotrichum graminicola]
MTLSFTRSKRAPTRNGPCYCRNWCDFQLNKDPFPRQLSMPLIDATFQSLKGRLSTGPASKELAPAWREQKKMQGKCTLCPSSLYFLVNVAIPNDRPLIDRLVVRPWHWGNSQPPDFSRSVREHSPAHSPAQYSVVISGTNSFTSDVRYLFALFLTRYTCVNQLLVLKSRLAAQRSPVSGGAYHVMRYSLSASTNRSEYRASPRQTSLRTIGLTSCCVSPSGVT